jgi:hypothetical protein
VQALLVAFIGSFFPLISSATIALVSLCKDAKEGLLLFLWISLILGLIQQASTDNPLLAAVSIASLGIMVIAAKVHRHLASWQWTLLATIVISVACAFSLGLLMGPEVSAFLTTVEEMLAAINSKQQDAQTSLDLTESILLGIVATLLAIGSIMSLILARWWQAGIYNPGGFQNEFHSFKIEVEVAVILVTVLLAGQFMSKSLQIWVDLAALPLLIAGIALIHFAVKSLDQGRLWLAFLYVGIILAGKPVTVILLVLGLTDSLIDLRSRLEGYKNSKT